jgi:hypothetical protein
LNLIVKISTQRVYLKDISVVWYRKFGFLTDYEMRLNSVKDLTDFPMWVSKVYELILSLWRIKMAIQRSLTKSKLEVLNMPKCRFGNSQNDNTERDKVKF